MSDKMRRAFKETLCGVRLRRNVETRTSQRRSKTFSWYRPLLHESERVNPTKDELVKICRRTLEFNIFEINVKI